MGKPRHSAEDVVKAVEECRGVVTAVAKRLGVSRSCVYVYRDRWASVRKALDESRERTLDEAESVLLKKALDGEDTACLIFFLKTQGKRRGYVERQEVTGKDGGSLEVVYEIGGTTED